MLLPVALGCLLLVTIPATARVTARGPIPPHWPGLPMDPSQVMDDNDDTEDPNKDATDGDPVILPTGNFSLTKTDLRIRGRGMDFEFTRTYRSGSCIRSPLGVGWDHNWNQQIVVVYDTSGPENAIEGAYYFNGQLRVDQFEAVSFGSPHWTSPPGYFSKLRHEGPPDIQVQPPDEFELRAKDGRILTFEYDAQDIDPYHTYGVHGATYRLTRLEDRMGNAFVLRYEWGDAPNDHYRRLEKVTDTLGREITFAYQNEALLSITDFTGRTILFGMGSTGNLETVRSPLMGTEYSTGKTVEYRYDQSGDPHNLVEIVDSEEHQNGNGSGTAYLKNTYLGERVVRQEYGGTNASGVIAGGTFSFVYESERVPLDRGTFFEAARTLVVDPNGNVSLHLFDPEGNERVCWEFTGRLNPLDVDYSDDIYTGLVSVDPNSPSITDSLQGGVAPLRQGSPGPADPGAYVTKKTFNGDGQLTALEEPGYHTTYTYDDASIDTFQRGNLLIVSRQPVPAGGEPIVDLYAYEPIFNNVRAYVEPRGADDTYLPLTQVGHDIANYTTHTRYDYQEAAADDAFAMKWGIDLLQQSQKDALLPGLTVDAIDFNQSDLNDDGVWDQAFGNAVRIESAPARSFDNPVSGTMAPQTIITKTVFNDYSLPKLITDPKGNETSFEYYPAADPSGFDPRSSASSDGGGFMHRTVDEEAVEGLFEYDVVGRVTRVIDGRGFPVDVAYNELDQVVEHTNALGYQTRSVYDWNDNLIELHVENLVPEVVDGLPTGVEQQGASGEWIVHRYTYDILDNLIEEDLQADGSTRLVTQYRYDKNSNRVMTLSPESVAQIDASNVRSVVFDERDKVFEVTSGGVPAGFEQNAAHGDIAAPSSSPDASTTRCSYDLGGKLISLIDGDGKEFEREYDPFERVIKSIDPLGNWTDYAYDPASNVISVKHYEGQGGASKLLAESSFKHDELNRLFESNQRLDNDTLGMTIPDGPLSAGDEMVTTRQVFDENSLIVRIVDDNTVPLHLTYDKRNRLKTLADDQGNTTTYTYDKADNAIHTTELELGGGSSTFNHWNFYDKLGRKHATVNDIGHVYRSVYDSRNNLAHHSDACADGTAGYDPVSSLDLYGEHSGLPLLNIPGSGNGTEYTYDDYNRLLTTVKYMRVGGAGGLPIDPTAAVDGRITMEREYDLNSRLKLQRDDPKASGSSGATRYGYDSLNRRTTITLADGHQESRTYNKRSLVEARTDPNGTMVTSAYDDLGRLITRGIDLGLGVEGTLGELYVWDGLSRLRRTADDDTQLTRRYDMMSRVIRERLNSKRTDTVYDGVGLLTNQVYPGLRNIARSYDSINRLASVADSGAPSPIASYTYEGPSRVKARSMLNNTDLTVGYDGIRRTTSVLHASATGTVDHRAFGWDGANNKEIRVNYLTGFSHRYAYDSAYRMVKSTRSKPGAADDVVDYTLDGVGNREDVDGQYNPNAEYTMSSPDDELMNQYTGVHGDTLDTLRTYDHNGNLTSIAGDRNATLVYDYRNQLIRYEDLDTNQQHLYGYDALGRRFVKTVDAGGPAEESMRFFYDGWQVVEEQTPSGTTKATYVYGNGLDEVLTMNRGGNNYYYHQDDLDNVNKMTDSLGVEVESFEYSDYGLVLDATTFAPIPDPVTRTVPHVAVGNPYYFAGARLDEETGLYYMRRRYMEPWTGRFVGRDPLGIWADTANCGNAQAYAGSNPWTLKDPLGLMSIRTEPSSVPFRGGPPSGGSGRSGSVAGGLLGRGGETGKPSMAQPFKPINMPGQPPIIAIPVGGGGLAVLEVYPPTDLNSSSMGSGEEEPKKAKGEAGSTVGACGCGDPNCKGMTRSPRPSWLRRAWDRYRRIERRKGMMGFYESRGTLDMARDDRDRDQGRISHKEHQERQTARGVGALIGAGAVVGGWAIVRLSTTLAPDSPDNDPADAAKGGAEKTEGLQEQLEAHIERLEEFKADPDAHDNKGFLRNAPTQERRDSIINGRINNLEGQIENFRKQILEKGGG
jgi:RHS repeat-associated protein